MKQFGKFNDLQMKVPSLKKVQDKLNFFIEELKKCETSVSALPIIKKYFKYNDEIETQFTIISIRYSLATDDPACQKARDKVDEMMPFLQNVDNEWKKVLSKVPYREELEKVFGSYYFQMIDSSLKAFDEKIIPELIEENKLSSEYDRVFGGAKIDFRGEIYNLSQMEKFTTSKDRSTRKEASQAVNKWLEDNEKLIGDIYSKLVKVRDEMAKKLGFENFIPLGYLRLGRVDYNPIMVKDYREQIKKTVVPICNKLYREQAKRLGYKMKDMLSYDYKIKFLSGNPTPCGEEKYIVEKASEMYNEMSKETGEFFGFMKEHGLLDLSARPGKAPGGYMTYLPVYKAPFIFSNFNNTQGDIEVITHEVGHAFQGYMSSNIKVPAYRSPTLEACEIHSMSMEFFAHPYADKFFKGDDIKKFLYSCTESAIEFLPYGITVDEFQHWVYEHPLATHEERCEQWKNIERSNLPHLRYDGLSVFEHGGYWIRQSHIFGVPFYYIDYTLAQVVAFQFFNEMRKNPKNAWKKYVKLCKFGGKAPFVGLLEANHLRNPFLDGNVKKAILPVYKYLTGLDISSLK